MYIVEIALGPRESIIHVISAIIYNNDSCIKRTFVTPYPPSPSYLTGSTAFVWGTKYWNVEEQKVQMQLQSFVVCLF